MATREIALDGGPFDGASVFIPHWVEALVLADRAGKLHWYLHIGPPLESQETHDLVLYHSEDESREVASLSGAVADESLEESLDDWRRQMGFMKRRLRDSLETKAQQTEE